MTLRTHDSRTQSSAQYFYVLESKQRENRTVKKMHWNNIQNRIQQYTNNRNGNSILSVERRLAVSK